MHWWLVKFLAVGLVQYSSITQSCPNLCDPMDCSTAGFPVHHQLLELAQTCVHRVRWTEFISSSVILFSSYLQSFSASGAFPKSKLFESGGQRFGVSSSASSFQWIFRTGWISFRIGWLDLLAVQGTLKSLLQHHSSEASVLWHSGFFIVQLSYPYMTTGKNIAFTRWTFVGKVMSLCFLICYLGCIVFLPGSKHLLISWLQSSTAVILKPPKINSLIVSPPICHGVMGPDAMILVFWMLSLSQCFHSPLSLPSRSSLVLPHFLP